MGIAFTGVTLISKQVNESPDTLIAQAVAAAWMRLGDTTPVERDHVVARHNTAGQIVAFDDKTSRCSFDGQDNVSAAGEMF